MTFIPSFFQVSFTPNGMDMKMLQPTNAPLRRHFLPGLKVEYSVSSRQSSYRVQVHRIQVGQNLQATPNVDVLAMGQQEPTCVFPSAAGPEPAARRHLPLRLLPRQTAQVHHHGLRSAHITPTSSATPPPLVCVLILLCAFHRTEPKPLTDISIVTRTAGHSDISRIK